MLTATELKALLTAHGLRLTKRLGQHHLIEPRIIARIIDSARLTRDDTVLDIGAGLGALTEAIAQRAGRVIAVEIDRGIAALLAQRVASLPNVRIVQEDIVQFQWSGLGRTVRQVVAVGAIPYHLTSPILVWLCEHHQRIREAVLVVQDEVAQRLAAPPGTKAYGRLSVLAQYSWRVHALFRVPPHVFFPQPEVDSACVRFTRRERAPLEVRNEPLFFDVVKAAFGQRRKTLANCLVTGLGRGMSRASTDVLIRQLGLPVAVRGEALSLEQFAALTNALDAGNSLRS